MLINPKFSGYKDYRTKLILRENIADLSPYNVNLPDPPPLKEFVNYGMPIEKQFFQREQVPDWLPKLNRMAKQRNPKQDNREIAGNIAWKNKEMREYIAEMWRKREEGIYIYINGRPLWIPGNMWYFLNYYHIFQHGLPDFRFQDVEWWYWWNECVVNNPLCYGGIEMAMRRDGKTSRHASNFIEQITKYPVERYGGFIGRSKEDSKKAFLRAYIIPIRKLPFFFTPLIDSSREYPQNEMYFRDPDNVDGGLLSRIDQRPTVSTAYDGEPLSFFHGNEWGKVSEMLVSECWDITKECLQVQGKIRGKSAIESTVEEMNVGGMGEFIKIFQASNNSPQELEKNNGQTESGLLPYYRPGYEIYVIDQYGFSIIDKPTEEQAEWRKKQLLKEKGGVELVKRGLHMKGGRELVDLRINSVKNAAQRQGVIRRYSRTIREAFRKDAKDCQFDIEKIENRLDDFRYGNTEVVAVKLSWRGNVPDGYVDYRVVEPADAGLGYSLDECEGVWIFKKNLWEYIQTIANNVKIINGYRVPGNKKLGIIAADPYKFDADATETKRKSMGVCHASLLHDISIDPGPDIAHWKTDDLVMEFSFRGSVDDFDEYLMMTVSFLGMKFCPETNSGDVLPQFGRRRYDKFLYTEEKAKTEAGVIYMEQAKNAGFNTLGENTRIPLFSSVDQYIDDYSHKCVFPRFLENCRDVEPNTKSMTKMDYFMSGGNTIRLAGKMNYRENRADRASYYTCEHHPEVRLLLQGECPKCGERLEKEVPKGFQGFDAPQRVMVR